VTVVQGTEENPLTFLQHLKDAIRNHTTVDPESQVQEVFLKGKFLTQSAPDIHRRLQKSMAEGKKSLDQLMQLAMHVYYNQNVTKKKEKKTKDTMTSLQLSGSAPPNWGLHPELATTVDKKGKECPKGGQPRKQPRPPPGPCPLYKGNHWKFKCPCLQMEGGVPPPMN
jgi:hypothetical protein